VKIEFGFSAFACKAPQPAQRNLEVARAEFLLVVVIAELAPFPDLDRRAIAGRGAADPNSFGVVATMPEGRAATRADPLAAARVAVLLFLEALAEHLHELVPAVLFERGLLFGRELLLEFLDQPLEGDFLALRIQGGDLAVVRGKGAIVAVEERVVLHQRHARRTVAVVDRGLHAVGAQRLQQREIFLNRDGQPAAAQVIEKIKQHDVDPEGGGKTFGAGRASCRARLSCDGWRAPWRPGARAA